jgi:antitoxin (DNA-binding transcriptional repressor) of toxin-antitoxin stability system
MSTRIDVRELLGRLSEALAVVSAGGEVLLTDGVSPRVRLVPCAEPGSRVPGLHAGAIQVAPDFDAPLPDDFWTGKS